MVNEDPNFTKASLGGDAGVQQCLQCGALVGGWSPEIGNGEWRHLEWHRALEDAVQRATPEEQ